MRLRRARALRRRLVSGCARWKDTAPARSLSPSVQGLAPTFQLGDRRPTSSRRCCCARKRATALATCSEEEQHAPLLGAPAVPRRLVSLRLL